MLRKDFPTIHLSSLLDLLAVNKRDKMRRKGKEKARIGVMKFMGRGHGGRDGREGLT